MNKIKFLNVFFFALVTMYSTNAMETNNNNNNTILASLNSAKLFNAIQNNDLDTVKKVLDSNSSIINEPSYAKDNKTPLGFAVDMYFKHPSFKLEIIEVLLKLGAHPDLYSIDETGKKDKTALYRSLRPTIFFTALDNYQPRYPLFSLLFQYGANPRESWKSAFCKSENVYESTIKTFIGNLPQIRNLAQQDQDTKILDDELMFVLLLLDLFDKETKILDAALKDSHEYSDNIKKFILDYVKDYYDYFNQLALRVKNDLDQKEKLYSLVNSNKSLFSQLQTREINGSSPCTKKLNTFIFNGKNYSLFQKFKSSKNTKKRMKDESESRENLNQCELDLKTS